MSDAIEEEPTFIARCPTHGLHGQRHECFVCGGPVEQVPFVEMIPGARDVRTSPRERLLRLFTSAPNAFWRHDVDVSLSAAVRMARFAQVAGIQSTFYLNPRSDFYNLFSREGEYAVSCILDTGHKLGVHVDYRDGSVKDAVMRDLRLIVQDYPDALKVPTQVSFHMPPTCVLWVDQPGFESAYASKWEGRYVSDSRGEWDDTKALLVQDGWQVNLHPEHWFGA